VSAAHDYLADSNRELANAVAAAPDARSLESELQLPAAARDKAKKQCMQCRQWQTRGAVITLADGSKLWLCKPCAVVKLAEARPAAAVPLPAVSTPTQLRGVGAAAASAPATDPAVLALRRKAVKAIGEKKYEAGRDLLLQIVALDKGDTVATYNAACCEALLGNVFEALSLLQRALDAGYSNYHHIYTDADIASVRRLPQFPALMEQHDPTFDAAEFLVANRKADLYSALPNLDTLNAYSEGALALSPRRQRSSAYATSADVRQLTNSVESNYGSAPLLTMDLEQAIQQKAIVYSGLPATPKPTPPLPPKNAH
jgi:tetratricopeptide (TPR) repeat protein